MTEKEVCKVLQETLDRYRAMQNPEFYIKAGWDVWNTAERLRISEEEVRSTIEERRKRGIRLGNTLLNAMIMMDYTVPEMIRATGWTEDEIRILHGPWSETQGHPGGGRAHVWRRAIMAMIRCWSG